MCTQPVSPNKTPWIKHICVCLRCVDKAGRCGDRQQRAQIGRLKSMGDYGKWSKGKQSCLVHGQGRGEVSERQIELTRMAKHRIKDIWETVPPTPNTSDPRSQNQRAITLTFTNYTEETIDNRAVRKYGEIKALSLLGGGSDGHRTESSKEFNA